MDTIDKALNRYHCKKAKVRNPKFQEKPGDMPWNFDILGTSPHCLIQPLNHSSNAIVILNRSWNHAWQPNSPLGLDSTEALFQAAWIQRPNTPRTSYTPATSPNPLHLASTPEYLLVLSWSSGYFAPCSEPLGLLWVCRNTLWALPPLHVSHQGQYHKRFLPAQHRFHCTTKLEIFASHSSWGPWEIHGMKLQLRVN